MGAARQSRPRRRTRGAQSVRVPEGDDVHRLRTLGILTALAVFIAACSGPPPPPAPFDLVVSIEGSGEVRFDTATGDDAAGTSEHARDAEVTLVATPADGNTFVRWGGACAGTDATCVVTMDADKSVTAVFEAEEPLPEEVQLSVAYTGSSGGGTVTQADLGIACPYDPGTGETAGGGAPVPEPAQPA